MLGCPIRGYSLTEGGVYHSRRSRDSLLAHHHPHGLVCPKTNLIQGQCCLWALSPHPLLLGGTAGTGAGSRPTPRGGLFPRDLSW